MKRYFVLLLCLSLLCGTVFSVAVSADDPVTVRFGIYQNAPLVFTTEDGHASGIFIDVLEYIADKESWTIEYVPGNWADLLDQLERGEIDMIGAIAHTEARSALFDFSTEPVITNWGQIYTQPDAEIESILDLEGKTLAMLKADIHAEAAKNLLQSFDVSVHLTEVEDYQSVFDALERGEADVGLVNRLVAIQYAGDYDVRETGIIFNPVENRYAVTKSVHQDLLAALDANLQALKADGSSIYYQSMEKWLGMKPVEKPVIPGWIKWMLIGIAVVAGILIGGNFILRSRVKSKTKELAAEVAEHKRAEERINHLNLVLLTIRNVNQLITKERDRKKLLKGVCSSLTATQGYYSVWIALLDESGKLTEYAESKLGRSFLPMVERLKQGRLPACGQRALKQSEVIVTSDPALVCTDCSISGKYTGSGGVTARLEHGGKVYGLLSVSVPLELATDAEELDLFHEVAGDIAFALHDMERDEQHKQAEAERQELERKAQVTDRLASVGEMASGIAHEINNPLTSVVGFSDLLLEKDLPEDLREDVEIIHDGSQRVAGIVKRLLTFARQHKPERTYTDINEIIESTLALRKYSLETGNIEVNTSLDAELPWTMADRGQLQQVFMNIIVNAETEMKQAHGRGKLIVKTERIGNTIRMSFKDDGPGIAKENLEKVFDPFFTTKEVGEGTGLGLSLSYGIIAEHKGALYAESEAGEGATFIIELPVVAEEGEKVERVEAVEGDGKAPEGRILVVDDEPTILAFLKKVLCGEGYDVETAGSGEEAIDKIGSEEYGLILCDIKLPGLSGIEIYDEIGKTAPSLQKRVIFITGDVMTADTRRFLEKTGTPYVTKPFDIAKLKEEVRRAIAGAG